MESSGRLFNCVRCRKLVTICRYCDCNRIYCSKICARAARKASLKAAGQRYQNSHRGRLKHAARQKAYRQRQKEKVTHHTSPITPQNDSLLPTINKHAACSISPTITRMICHFCGRRDFAFLRSGFLRHQSQLNSRGLSNWPLGP